jgi:GST-like protein
MEVKRQLDVLDRRLAESAYIAGDDYSIADIAIWPWYGTLARGQAYDAGTFLQVQDYKNVQRWTEAVGARPAVKRGRMVNRVTGQPSEQLHERHDASDFLTRTQDGPPRAARPPPTYLRGTRWIGTRISSIWPPERSMPYSVPGAASSQSIAWPAASIA